MKCELDAKNNKTEKAVVEAIAFFDIFNYPLTEFELWQYCGIKCGLLNVQKILKSNILAGIIDRKNGFYFMAGRNKIINTKTKRYNYTNRKFKRALFIAKIFKIIPWIKMIAVGNIIGAHNLKDGSDIDLFIITEPGRIWVTRFFCVFIAQLLGLRPKENKMRDKICLSFFISEDAMNLRGLILNGETVRKPFLCHFGQQARLEMFRNGADIAIPTGSPVNTQDDNRCTDIYFIYWLAGLVPVYDRDNTYKNFIKSNKWLKKHLPNWQPVKISHRYDSGKGASYFFRDVIDLLIGDLEQKIKRVQLKLMSDNLKESMNKDSKVVINDQILKLHVNDRRKEYRKRWEKKLAVIEPVERMLK